MEPHRRTTGQGMGGGRKSGLGAGQTRQEEGATIKVPRCSSQTLVFNNQAFPEPPVIPPTTLSNLPPYPPPPRSQGRPPAPASGSSYRPSGSELKKRRDSHPDPQSRTSLATLRRAYNSLGSACACVSTDFPQSVCFLHSQPGFLTQETPV